MSEAMATTVTAKERFVAALLPPMPNGCWHLDRRAKPIGYVVLVINGRSFYAHRIAHELYKGPIPDGLEIDHLCRNRQCCNPDHLEAVTRRVNAKRGLGGHHMKIKSAMMTHCKRGHEFDERNTAFNKTGGRVCRKCAAAKQRRLYHETRVRHA
jgi:hypothetical protein